MEPRYLFQSLKLFAEQKFVLLSGPRQCGKTTLARHWLAERGAYLNWDDPEQRETILKRSFLKPLRVSALVLDEIHKYQRWKSWLKGLYDNHAAQLSVVVTGSARLELSRKSGESMFGRYEHLRLHPFTIGELSHGCLVEPPKNWLKLPKEAASGDIWERLHRMGGFPEPYLRNEEQFHRRWSLQRKSLLLKEDLRDLTEVRAVSLVEHLALLLPQRVGGLLSVNSLREELEVAHGTVSTWLDILDHLYYCFRIGPYHTRVSRALKKEQKLYLWDWSEIEDRGARFENMVACHLLKAVHAWNDRGLGEFALQFVRDKEKHEIDFLLTEKRKPLVLFECKSSDGDMAMPRRLLEQFGKIPAIQLVDVPAIDWGKGQQRVVSAERYLTGLL